MSDGPSEQITRSAYTVVFLMFGIPFFPRKIIFKYTMHYTKKSKFLVYFPLFSIFLSFPHNILHRVVLPEANSARGGSSQKLKNTGLASIVITRLALQTRERQNSYLCNKMCEIYSFAGCTIRTNKKHWRF